MKIKNVLGITSIVSVMALGVAFAVSPREAAVVKATGPYSIADDEYEAAFLEQYDDNGTAVTVENYSYANDKPLGHDSVGGHLYGIAGPKASNLKQTKFETNLYGVNETLQWRFSGLNTKSKTNPNCLYIQIENNSSNWNICNAESFPQDTCPDEYAIGQLIVGKGKAKGAVMFTTTAIKDVQDISFFWRSSYAQAVYIVYKIEGGEWKILEGTGSSNGNYTGTRGWDSFGYTTFKSGSWTSKELYGATAQIGIACTEAPTESGNLPVSAVMINANKAAVRYLNILSYQTGVCSESTYDLNKSVDDKAHNQDLFHLATEHADADFLAEYEVAGLKTTETSALGLYNHLVSSVSGLGPVKSASSIRFFNGIASFENGDTLVIIISVSAVSLVALGLVLFKKYKKQK